MRRLPEQVESPFVDDAQSGAGMALWNWTAEARRFFTILRVYIHRARIYAIAYVGKTEADLSGSDATRFMNSLRFQ